MHVQSNRTHTRVHLYCTRSISDANDGVLVAAVLSVVQHNVSHDNVGERMTTSKNGRVIYVHRWLLGSRERVENQPITIKCAENETITNECAENYQPITKSNC